MATRDSGTWCNGNWLYDGFYDNQFYDRSCLNI